MLTLSIILFIVCFSPVINVTLPDEKQNYVHRIGRVGRAERSELASKTLTFSDLQ